MKLLIKLLIRKKIKVSSDVGLLIETLMISPIAIGLFIYLMNANMNIFSYEEPLLSFYLFWSGFMTLVPLFLYTIGFKIIGIGPASMILFLTPTMAQLKIGYILSERIRTEFEDFKEAESQLQLEYRKVQTEFDKMVLKMDSLKQDYEVKRLMALDKGESIKQELVQIGHINEFVLDQGHPFKKR